ncbi:AzlC family ABC transporter permease [Streptomyces pristinaespiralis]|uniref:AzlC family ABC transporter permease n=1 Tax=Streptomyces pristinaespiralis TaxID=38300 RepID=UPI0037BA655B
MNLGLVPMGLAFGILATHTGLPWWTTPLFSTVMYTGTLEFLLVPTHPAAARRWGPCLLAGSAETVALHLWRRNALLSVFAGTAVCIALSSTVFRP